MCVHWCSIAWLSTQLTHKSITVLWAAGQRDQCPAVNLVFMLDRTSPTGCRFDHRLCVTEFVLVTHVHVASFCGCLSCAALHSLRAWLWDDRAVRQPEEHEQPGTTWCCLRQGVRSGGALLSCCYLCGDRLSRLTGCHAWPVVTPDRLSRLTGRHTWPVVTPHRLRLQCQAGYCDVVIVVRYRR